MTPMQDPDGTETTTQLGPTTGGLYLVIIAKILLEKNMAFYYNMG